MPLRPSSRSKVEYAAIEIVAVAGIGASWETWKITPKGTDDAIPHTLTKAAPLLNSSARSGSSSLHRVNSYVENHKPQHTETIFEDIPRARVWFYEYPEIQTNQDFGFYADKLLDDLIALVRSQGTAKRPLHLVGHSTGGLVIKYALIKAFTNQNLAYAEIAESCFSLAFFGVPHYGSTILHEDVYKASIETMTGMKLNNKIRLTLNPANRTIFRQEAHNFAPLSSSMRQIWAFVEGLESDLRVLSANAAGEEETDIRYFVVDERSATLSTSSVRIGNEKVITVNSTHANLARFGGTKDNAAYREYVGDLQALIEEMGVTPGSSLSWRENTISDEVVAEVHLFYEIQDTEPDNIIKIFSVESKLSTLVRKGPTACLRKRLTNTNSVNNTSELLPHHTIPLENIEHDAVDSTQRNGLSAVPQAPPEFAVPSIILNDMPIEEPIEQPSRRGSITKGRTLSFSSTTTGGRSHLTEPIFKGREEYVELPRREDLFELPTLSSQKFRWIRIPCNNMAFIPRIFQCIAEETKRPVLMDNLIHEQVFHEQQAIARHGRPHGRYMQPFFHTIDLEKTKPPKLEDKQFVMYFPYLHWDTFNSLMKRNEIIKKRFQQPRPYPLDKSIMKGPSEEHRLIWHYLTHPSNLPLHHRRSLDQYGYPTLRDISARDLDQVLYKRTRADADAELEQKKSGIRSKLKEAKKRARNKARGVREDPVDDGARGTNAKVLMVDCIWLWIMDERTVITCFPSRETTDIADNHADLRDAIYRDINGDPRLATHCRTCVEFAALVIRHAVTVFLEQKSDKDLEVFRIFEEYISILTEHVTKSFKDFRNKHQKPFFSLDELEEIHDNSNDLWCFLELRDVEDELDTIKKLLTEQRRVIEEFQKVEVKNGLPSNAQNFLQEALHKLSYYQTLIDHMLHNCSSAQGNVKTLLDMKQKKANVVEAALARKAADRAAQQSRAVMTFTVFTVFFLPLSFFTSLFGMNVSEWSGSSTNLPMHTVLVLMCGVSAAVISLALLLAFNKPVRNRAGLFYHALKEWWNGEEDSQETNWNASEKKFQGRFFKRFRRQRPDIHDDVERGKPRNGIEILEAGLDVSHRSSVSSNRLKTE